MPQDSDISPASAAASYIPYIGAAVSGINAISRGGPRRQFKWSKKYAEYQNQLNRGNAEWTLAQNRALRDEQRQYDSPQAQMQRYIEAGLNPHLIYDKVTGVSSPISMGNLPAASGGNIDTSYGNIASEAMQAELMQTQLGVSNQKIAESKSKEEVNKAQEELIRANPQMRSAYVDAMVLQMEATAALKDQEKRYLVDNAVSKGSGTYTDMAALNSVGMQKMAMELDLLAQKYDLGKADQKVKAEIIESKGWENDLKEVQARWLKDGDITPQHIYQGIMMLLMKLR